MNEGSSVKYKWSSRIAFTHASCNLRYEVDYEK